MSNGADLLLVSACLEGREDAWQQLTNTHTQHLYCFLRGQTHRDCDELHAFLWEFWGDVYSRRLLVGYTGIGTLKSWLRSVALHRWLNAYKSSLRWQRCEDVDGIIGTTREPLSHFSEVEFSHTDDAIRVALMSLNERHRLVMWAHLANGIDQQVIADRLGLRCRSQVSQLLKYAIPKFRKVLRSELQKRHAVSCGAQELALRLVDVLERLFPAESWANIPEHLVPWRERPVQPWSQFIGGSHAAD